MTQNLWQVVNYDDLLYNLRSGNNKFILLSLVLLDTDEKIKKMIKKFIKRKSESLPNALFLYYVVRDEDLGRNGLLKKDKTKYPKICHMYGMTDLLLEIVCPPDEQYIEQSFMYKVNGSELEKWYAKLPNDQSDKNNDDDNGYNDNNNDDEQKQESNSEKSPHNQNQQDQYNNINNAHLNQQIQMQQYQVVDPITEKKKFLQKLLLLKSKSDEYDIAFLKEIQKRKKEEEKNKKQEK